MHHVLLGALEGQKRVMQALELKLKALVISPMGARD